MFLCLHFALYFEHGWHEYNEKGTWRDAGVCKCSSIYYNHKKGALQVMPKLEEILHVQRGE